LVGSGDTIALFPNGSLIRSVNFLGFFFIISSCFNILFPLAKRFPVVDVSMNVRASLILSRIPSTFVMKPSLYGPGVIVAPNSGMLTVAVPDLITRIFRSSRVVIFAETAIGSRVVRGKTSVCLYPHLWHADEVISTEPKCSTSYSLWLDVTDSVSQLGHRDMMPIPVDEAKANVS
jgi:hypothetical protein